jgi:hypothetical protein
MNPMTAMRTAGKIGAKNKLINSVFTDGRCTPDRRNMTMRYKNIPRIDIRYVMVIAAISLDNHIVLGFIPILSSGIKVL